VAPLRREQALLQMVARRDIGEKGGKAILRQAEEALVLPERVVGVEGDGVECGHGHLPGRRSLARRAGAGKRPCRGTLFSPYYSIILGIDPLVRESPEEGALGAEPRHIVGPQGGP